MKNSMRSACLILVFLASLLSGCAPASTPIPPTATATPTLIPPTLTPVPTSTATAVPSPTPSENMILDFQVVSATKEEIIVSIEYFYLGDHGPFANIYVVPHLADGKPLRTSFRIFKVEAGHHSVDPVIDMTSVPAGDYVIAGFTVAWYGAVENNETFFSEDIQHELAWPPK